MPYAVSTPPRERAARSARRAAYVSDIANGNRKVSDGVAEKLMGL